MCVYIYMVFFSRCGETDNKSHKNSRNMSQLVVHRCIARIYYRRLPGCRDAVSVI